jgi:multiple antibiotic resistance protein
MGGGIIPESRAASSRNPQTSPPHSIISSTTVPKTDARAKIERCCYKTGMKHLTAVVALTLVPFAAAAQNTGVLATKRPITWGMIFTLLFLMLGPIKLLGTFAAVTKDCDRIFRLRLATRAFLFSSAAVTIAAALGKQMLDNFAIPVLCCRSPRA